MFKLVETFDWVVCDLIYKITLKKYFCGVLYSTKEEHFDLS